MGHSSDLTYQVQRDELHWVVCLGGDHCGRFGSRNEAIRSAVADAKRVRNLGHRVAVLVQRLDGALQPLSEARFRALARR